MINILLISKNDNFTKLKVFGHSGYDVLGKDIVCAAVSSVVQSIVIGLKNVICEDFIYVINDEDAYVFIDISNYNVENMSRAQILFNTFKYTMDSLILDYGKYIKVKIRKEQ